MKRLSLVLALFLWPALAYGQDVPLVLKGDTTVIKVEETITTIVSKDATVVKSLPCTITAPSPGFGYQWTVPDGVKAQRRGKVLTITAAPKGPLTIEVDFSVIDFKTQSQSDYHGSITFYIGDVTPPKPPDPPQPVDAFTKAVQDAYAAETDANKLAYVQRLAAYYDGAGVLVDASATVKELFDRMKTGKLALMPAGSLPRIMAVLGADEDTVIGTVGPLNKAVAKAEFAKIATALKSIK